MQVEISQDLLSVSNNGPVSGPESVMADSSATFFMINWLFNILAQYLLVNVNKRHPTVHTKVRSTKVTLFILH